LDLDPGTVVANRYRISRPLGRGGMGEVFAAENIRTGRPVAVKLLRSDTKGKSSAVQRFRQEARAAGSINSDHVTQVLDVEEDPEHGVVLVFELLEGESLIDRLKRTGPIPFDELHPIIEQVWMGLADAHRVGIIHRDLKPSNVFLEARPDGTQRVKILDFGISKLPKEMGGETLTEMGQSLGTFSFMPPEQIGKAKTVDHRADIYACATLIYQSLTGQLPYSARNILVMVEMKTKTDARKLGDAMGAPVEPRLEAFVTQGLSRDPAKRFQTAVDALAAWRDLRPAGVPSQQPGRTPSQRPPPQPAAPTPPQGLHRVAHPQTTPGPGPVAGSSNAGLPRLGSAPAIREGTGSLPRVAEITTEETAATLAMPMPHLGHKSHKAPQAPPLEPRLDSAAAIAQRPQLGPGGTQPVALGRGSGVDPAERAAFDEAKSGNLPAHPAGYYIPPAVQASLARGQAAPPQAAPPQAAAALQSPQQVPRMYDDASSQPSNGEGATQVYRPGAAAKPPDPLAPTLADPRQLAAPPPPKRSIPLVVLLLGFLVIGFVVVALVMRYAPVRP
jgi:serine/threonine-protein kinase